MSGKELTKEKLREMEADAVESRRRVNKMLAERDPTRTYRYNEKRKEFTNKIQLHHLKIGELQKWIAEIKAKIKELEGKVEKLDSDYENYLPTF
jgi:hypothetical protein